MYNIIAYCISSSVYLINYHDAIKTLISSIVQCDVAMFDFTSMYHSENACRVMERQGHKLLIGLVGDSLLEVTLLPLPTPLSLYNYVYASHCRIISSLPTSLPFPYPPPISLYNYIFYISLI